MEATEPSALETPKFPKPPQIPKETAISQDDKIASFGGHGTLEILRVTQILEANDIPCCLVGTSALIYYGANRVRGDWQICVPTETLDAASSLLGSEPYVKDYLISASLPIPQPGSLLHTFPRFKCNDFRLFFILVPSRDCHLTCKPSNFQRSQNGLPYPKLDVFIQSLLDMHDMVSLCDAIDGSNVSEEWGNENLELSGTNDMEWVKWKNDKITAQTESFNWLCEIETAVHERRESWIETVRGKQKRMGWKHPKELFVTQFRLRNSEDPWLRHRDAA